MCLTVSSHGCEQLNICEHEFPAASVTSKTTPCWWHHLAKEFYCVFKPAPYVSKPLCTLFSDSLPRTWSQTHAIVTSSVHPRFADTPINPHTGFCRCQQAVISQQAWAQFFLFFLYRPHTHCKAKILYKHYWFIAWKWHSPHLTCSHRTPESQYTDKTKTKNNRDVEEIDVHFCCL